MRIMHFNRKRMLLFIRACFSSSVWLRAVVCVCILYRFIRKSGKKHSLLSEPFLSPGETHYDCPHWQAHYKPKRVRGVQSLYTELGYMASYLEGKSCAVVGASGILQYSNFGTEIDAHDVVVRFGLPNLDKEISGVKTSMLLINPSALFMSNTTALSQSILNGARQTVQVLNPKIISVNCCTRLCYEKVHKLKEDDFIFQHRNTTASACSYISEVTRHLKDKYNWTSSGSILFRFIVHVSFS